MVGFCKVDVNDGPVQLYVAPGIPLTLKLSVAPAHRGPLFVGEGVLGIGFTVTVADPLAVPEQFASETAETV
jgi:hypothetical protein